MAARSRPAESWLWLFVLGMLSIFCVVGAYGIIRDEGWTIMAIAGVPVSLTCMYCFFYEWSNPLS